MDRTPILYTVLPAHPAAHRFEVRCTVDESELGTDDAERMARQIAELGVNHLVLQPRRDPAGRSNPISDAFVGAMQPWIPQLELRAG